VGGDRPGGTIAGILVIALAATWGLAQGWIALRAVGARPADRVDDARLTNIAAGLAATAGCPSVRVMVVPDARRNALVAWTPLRPTVAVTQGALADLVRTELEALVAHCVARICYGDVARAAIACSLAGSLTSVAPRVGFEDDVEAAALTRYPPALARVLRKLQPVPGRFGPLFVVADDPVHRPVGERVSALEDL
jgi:Zn-dependent protease with chaperone function